MSRPLRVLIVDDSQEDATLVLRDVSGAYAVTSEQVDDEEAMRTALTRSPWDLVISDWRMPSFSALAALAVVHEVAPDVPLIIVSGTVGEEAVVAALHAGARDFVAKDKLARLVPAIERELREREVGRARRTAEDALSASKEQVRQMQKMDAIGSLAGGVAHDFNNLLSIILGYSSLILSDPKLAAAHDDVAEIKHAGERAADLTRQLLAFGRRQVLEPKVVDLNEILLRMERMIRRLIGEDLVLEIVPANGLAKVNVDPGQVEQVIMNLAVNARDAMPSGGTLTIATSNVEPSVEAPEGATGHRVMLTVTDTGSGMDHETQSQAFEPFFTTKPVGKGTGLGLSTVFGIVKQSGGSITLESKLGRGTTFAVYFPRVADERLPRRSGTSVAPTSGAETILVTEDETQLRALMRTVLMGQGYRVFDACDGLDALRQATAYEGTIHLLLTDVVMPAMSGKELASRLATTRPKTRVLYMSGYTDDAIANHGVLNTGIAFIQKPFRPDALIRRVREVLDGDEVAHERTRDLVD